MSCEKAFLEAIRAFCTSQHMTLDERNSASLTLPRAGGGDYVISVAALLAAPDSEPLIFDSIVTTF